jgi:hypothetical protein
MTRAVRLYDGSSDNFISDTIYDWIVGRLGAGYSSTFRGERPVVKSFH